MYNLGMQRIVGITSDTHFGHANIILYTNRPFVDLTTEVDARGRWISNRIALQRVDEMDDALISGWNSVAKNDDDIIVHLGDFSFGDVSRYLQRLNGTIWFVSGNHDKQMHAYLRQNPKQTKVRHLGKLDEIDLYDEHGLMNRSVVCHFAMRVWNKSHFGAWHLYGHSHGTLEETDNLLSMDVGVDAAKKRIGEYRPFTPEEIHAVMEKRVFKPLDHHGGDK